MSFEQRPAKTTNENITVCARCKAWRDCWIAPNGKHLCDDCKEEFGLWFCNRCLELAPQVSFIWLGDQHLCYDCYIKETSQLTTIHTRYLQDNPDVAVYLKPKERVGGQPRPQEDGTVPSAV
jgi:hypothetical protein